MKKAANFLLFNYNGSFLSAGDFPMYPKIRLADFRVHRDQENLCATEEGSRERFALYLA